MDRTVYIPFFNLSYNAGKLNPSGLIQADGVVHGGASFLGMPPLYIPTTTALTGATADGPAAPVIAHVNLATRADSDDFTIFVYADKKIFKIVGTLGAITWTISDVSPSPALSTGPTDQEGQFVSFGSSEIFAAGVGDPVQIMLDGGSTFVPCFTSTDKPKAAHVCCIDQRLDFLDIANTGTAGSPDPNHSLLWWGATDDPQTIGNPLSLPQDLTDFQPLADDFGDGTGLSSGKERAVVFKKRALYVHQIGGPYGYEVPRVAAGIGLEFAHSITELADDTYFWSTLGPAVFRQQQVFLLGNGSMALRDLFAESPPDPDLKVLSAAADINNGIVCWLISYKSYDYTYAVDATTKVPSEAKGDAVLTYALLCYNSIADQLSFGWRVRDADGIAFVKESEPLVSHKFIPLCLVDRIPTKSTLPLASIGLIGWETGLTAGTSYPVLFAAGLPSTSFTPDWTLGQDIALATGFIPFNGEKVIVKGVRPILRTKRGFALPEISVNIKTTLESFSTERQFGPFALSTNADSRRPAVITTPGCAAATYVSVELVISQRTGTSSVAYAYLLSEIEGVELIIAPAGQA
jgi:hypothetical protein